ncbi:hypothetical protein EVG20_g8844, partial [Dentipellis fragilis]
RGLPTLTLGRPSSSFFTYIKSRSSLLTPPLFTGSTLAGGDSEQGHGHGHGHEQGYSIVRVHSAGQQITVNTSAAHRSTSVLIVPVDVQPPHQQQQQLEEGTLAGQDASPAKRRACASDDVEAQAGETGATSPGPTAALTTLIDTTMSSTTPIVEDNVSTAVPEESEFWSSVLSSRLASTAGITPFSLPTERERAQQLVLLEMKALQHMASATGRRYNAMSKIAIQVPFLRGQRLHEYDPQPRQESDNSLGYQGLAPRCPEKTMGCILQAFHRVENVVFRESNDHVAAFLKTSMPLLLSLEVHDPQGFETIDIPLEIFTGCAPRLRRIVLTGACFELPVGIHWQMNNLTSFTIDTNSYTFDSITHLRRVFGSMPNLQVLTVLHFSAPPFPFQLPEVMASSRKECLLLPPLADFTIQAISSILVPVFAAFRIAPGTNVALHHIWEYNDYAGRGVGEAAPCTLISAWIEDWSGDAGSLAARISFDAGIRPDFNILGNHKWMIELKRCFDEDRAYPDTGGDSATGTGDGVHSVELEPKFCYQASDNQYTLRECILAAILLPRGPRALTIYGSADDGTPKPRWRKLFEECQYIEHLCLTAADWLVHFIREWRTGGILFPNLKTLWIRNVDLTAATLSRAGAVDPAASPPRDSEPPLASQMVLERFIEQQRSSKPLDILYLMDSMVPEGWVEQLKSVVTVRLGHGDSQAPSCMRFGPARK